MGAEEREVVGRMSAFLETLGVLALGVAFLFVTLGVLPMLIVKMWRKFDS